jgi:hypothetical protein
MDHPVTLYYHDRGISTPAKKQQQQKEATITTKQTQRQLKTASR